MALITKTGYGQVEPNKLSAQKTGQIFAQLPYDANGAAVALENGMFLKYDEANGEANITGTGEFLLVYNEVKLYNSLEVGAKDFALKEADLVDSEMVPRLYKINVGDAFTTNLADVTTAADSRVGILLVPTDNGSDVAVLTETAAGSLVEGDEVYEVVAETTLPDGQYALKVRKAYTKGYVAP